MTLPTAQNRIDHVVVLMLENRSFDHMLGYLDHTSTTYPRLQENDQRFSNADTATGGGAIHHPTSQGRRVLPFDPYHSHTEVLKQTAGQAGPYTGFAASYLAKARSTGYTKTVVTNQHGSYQLGGLVMACQPPSNLPALATLAREFAVCTAWHSSVPGETWPNRNFVHAATSDGSVNNELGVYTDKTIFELLEKDRMPSIAAARRPWRIYHDGPAQVMAFRKLWGRGSKGDWASIGSFAAHAARGDLASYSFIEPNQNTPVANTVFPHSSSQHPGNNTVDPELYLAPPADADDDFAAGDDLVAQIYEALRANPAVFVRTILVVTYDEHGGLWDREPLPPGVPPADRRNGWLRSIIGNLIRRRSPKFAFDRLGVRVPAVVVSPWIEPGTIDATRRDHTAIPRTVRDLFAPDAPTLTKRDASVAPFWDLVTTRSTPRTTLPILSTPGTPLALRSAPPPLAPAADDYGQALLALARYVGDELSGGSPLPARDTSAETGRRRRGVSATGRTARDYFDEAGQPAAIDVAAAAPEPLTDQAATDAMERFAAAEHE